MEDPTGDQPKPPAMEAYVVQSKFDRYLAAMDLAAEQRDREFAKQKEEREEALRIQREALEMEKERVKAEIAMIKETANEAITQVRDSAKILADAVRGVQRNADAIADVRRDLSTVKEDCAQAKLTSVGTVARMGELEERFGNFGQEQKNSLEGGLATLKEDLSQEVKAEVFEKVEEIQREVTQKDSDV